MATGGRTVALTLHQALQVTRYGAALKSALRTSPQRSYATAPELYRASGSLPVGGMGYVVGERATTTRIRPKHVQEVGMYEKGNLLDLSLYSRRHKFPAYREMLALFQKGAIVEGMTRFYLAMKDWESVQQKNIAVGVADFEVSPHIVDAIIQILAQVATSPDDGWTGFEQKTQRGSYWIPPQLGPGEDVRRMNVPTLSMHALASVYDMAGAVNISPSSSALADAIHALSKHVDEDRFTKCVVLILLRMGGRSYQDSLMLTLSTHKIPVDMIQFQAVSPIVMKSILEGYGRLELPQVGEALLKRWSERLTGVDESEEQSQSRQAEMELNWQMATDGRKDVVRPPVWVQSSGWAHDAGIWTALIRSRAFSFDLAGARHWFERYRQEGLASVRMKQPDACGTPHVEYMLACTRIRKEHVELQAKRKSAEQLEKDDWIDRGKTRYETIFNVVKLMSSDGAALSSTVMTLLINFQLGYGRITESIGMISTFLESKEGNEAWLPNFYKALFHLHRLLYIRESHMAASKLASLVREDTLGNKRNIGNLRELYREFLKQPGFRSSKWERKVRMDALHEALYASLASCDLPLSLFVLEEFKADGSTISADAQDVILGFLFPSRGKDALRKARKNNRSWDLHQNMQQLMKENLPEAEFQQLVVSSSNNKTRESSKERAGRLVGYIKLRIVATLERVVRRGVLRETDAKWLHDCYPFFKDKEIVDADAVVRQVKLSLRGSKKSG